MNNKILIISDLHLSDTLPYSDIVKGGREKEQKEILSFIIEKAKDTDSVILGGDSMDKKNNSSEVIRTFTEFLEKFENKKLYILGGNHEKKPDGSSAIDYLKEIKNRNWEIITNSIQTIGNIDFCPYFSRAELGVKNNKEGQEMIMSKLKGNKILVVHYAISDSLTGSGQNTDIFNEIVLPREKLSEKYGLVVAGHIHSPELRDNILVTGSVFSRTIGEANKYIYKVDSGTLEIEKIKLPGRSIIGVENLTDFSKIPKNSIVKITITNKKLKEKIPEIRKELEKFDGYALLENYPRTRKKQVSNENVLDMDIEKLLKTYAGARKVSLPALLAGWNLIKD